MDKRYRTEIHHKHMKAIHDKIQWNTGYGNKLLGEKSLIYQCINEQWKYIIYLTCFTFMNYNLYENSINKQQSTDIHVRVSLHLFLFTGKKIYDVFTSGCCGLCTNDPYLL